MCRMPSPTRHQAEYRKCLGQFPTGVAVVTARDRHGRLVGMTINSFCSVSLVPALISWCVARRARSYLAFARAERFTVSVLAADQQAVAQRFATRGSDKFADMEDDGQSCPPIPGACAHFECDLHNSVSLGDHLMLVGRVTHFTQFDRRPLLFAENAFQQLPMTTALDSAAA